MVFTIRPNDPPQQRLVDKFVEAGWLEAAVVKDLSPGSGLVNMKWTELGRQKMRSFISLIREVERVSVQIKPDELPFFKAFAEIVEMQDSGQWPLPPTTRR